MTTLHDWATVAPQKPALIQAESGHVITYGELDARAIRAAQWLVSRGLEAGDCIAVLVENHPGLIEIASAARRVGLYYTAVNTHLSPAEAAYVLKDCGAKLLIASPAMLPLVEAVRAADAHALDLPVFVLAGASNLPPGFEAYEAAISAFAPDATLPPRPVGRDMLYSSGTTGHPKGIRRPLTPYEDRDKPELEIIAWRRAFGFDENTVYLSTAPFYHAAPLRYIMRTLDVGGTCVAMSKYDAEGALAAVERYRVTHSQWVPTMFVRLLGLPDEARRRYDLSSMKVAIHAAAPCPVHVKQAMLDWWGDILYEYYAGSEGAGTTSIGPLEWRKYPGSVGRASAGVIHIVDNAGNELPPNEVGMIYFSGVATFSYHNAPEKTRSAYNDKGWATYGDLGYVNEEGYLFLSDRRADLILSGGVNVYPQEIESVLMQHPSVADVAVIGVPDPELGEVPKAVIELRDGKAATPDLAQDIVDYCQGRLGRLKLPRTVVFDERLPRTPTGKLLRRELKDRHREQPHSGHAVRTGRA
ncbi:long-chain acyl-CoA synthetase [Cupriavidus metallidurans]|jgi:acyl-CoA synthetase (AMP-forming)/AMP-acid ligase II|uniref:Acyl-CoA ligase putative o-succinylbenzoate-CoA ligase n=1 Tax=Cupriavidus metallidurans (strain ATCC 43123 / DSM 2839 / NBRC 102507 / CH34) TaxID=266264 RepID=Q1LCV9_CUPMC|nr:acyl-CoA synthetase [Cupriavidus metallidurans]ABF12017.1 acyl-CoA ligase; putative o-succinylbenzoate-CoA ligase [Cupriavidus metallidurans CH34]AVA34290.1 acyl-CoA synthetase [Cupriavidus metallidurans]KWW32891.1 Long-chain-fatty-acid--CoA ligase [Cupriavidus metallidurans]MDE4922058.1 acyl-CoA synthetase [Cupriavidus metallidurans]QGS32711.1 AMP-binding protein [Cupriavidus metallidurans]